MREPMAEFAGVAVFVLLGTGVDCQVALSTNPGVASSPKGVSRDLVKRRDIFNLIFFLRTFSP